MAVVLDVTKPESTAAALGVELGTTTRSLTTRLDNVTIETVSDLQQQVLDRQALGDAMKRVESFFGPFKAMAHKLHRALCDQESDILQPLLRLDALKRNAIAGFKNRQDHERRERERAEAEQLRRARDAQAASEAAALEAVGEHATAAAVIEEAIAAPAPVVVLPDVTKTVEGLHFTRRWCWKYAGGPADVRETPPDVLARALALIPAEFLGVDEKKVGAYARSMKASARVPGIDFYAVDDPRR
jgi:hypothetical protein